MVEERGFSLKLSERNHTLKEFPALSVSSIVLIIEQGQLFTQIEAM